MLRPSSGFYYFRFPYQNLVRTSSLSHRRHMPCSFIFLNVIGRAILVKIQQWRSSLYDFLDFHVNHPFLAQISLSLPYLQITQGMVDPDLTQRKIQMAACSPYQTVDLFITLRRGWLRGLVFTPTQNNMENNNERSFPPLTYKNRASYI
jgi:hypothetical protein